MILLRQARSLFLASLTLTLLLPSTRALLNIDGTRNQVFVFGSATFGYTSNLFSQEAAVADYTITATAGAELKRRAGIISVDSTFKVDFLRFDTYTDENAVNPSFSLEFSKTTGRTTGSFSLSAFRETRSDNAVNLRTSSWNYPLALNLKYPINDKLYVTSNTGYLSRRYTGSDTLADKLVDLTESLDFYRVYTSKLDLLAGYRLRVSRNSFDTGSTDHWLYVGATGGLIGKLNGTLRIGYQVRHEHSTDDSYGHFNYLAALGWPVSRKLSLSAQANLDFTTIATGVSTENVNLGLRATYTYTRKLEFYAGVAGGYVRFLGEGQGGRFDDIFTWDIGAQYRFNEHLSLSANYSYFRNWSNFDNSNFDRHGFSFDIASRF